MNTVNTTLANILAPLLFTAAAPIAQHEPGGVATDAQGIDLFDNLIWYLLSR